MDEKPYQFLGNRMEPISMKPGCVEKIDYQYIRKGTCSIFIFTEPLAGWRKTYVCERRTKQDWAKQIYELLTVDYPGKKIRLVMDNLNTHVIAALYETYPPNVARDLAKRIEIHYTPKHGGWLNIAEIELSVMERRCLKRRISDIQTLQTELTAWHIERNALTKSVDWQFSTPDARIKLKRLYPILVNN
jgi:hypothetical protein